MRSHVLIGFGIAFALGSNSVAAQDLIWRPARDAAPTAPPVVTLGRPQPLVGEPQLAAGATPSHEGKKVLAQPGVGVPHVVYPQGFVRVSVHNAADAAATLEQPRPIFRGQSPDMPAVTVPPPPPPGGFGGPAVFPGGPAAAPIRGGTNAEAYNCGLVTSNADLGGFWSRCGDHLKHCWTDVCGAVTGTGGHHLFQSDHEYDWFISPVSNPIFFEDPRALTELRPEFIWQHTPHSNPVFAGGNNYVLNLQGRLALTENISFVVNKLGWTWIDPHNPVPGVLESGNGFSELHLGPKITFLRSEVSKTVAAVGLNFEIADGSSHAAQNTGNLSLSPYFSIAQNFGRFSYGSFNFMNTTGYSLGIDSRRSDFLYASFHLDYDVFDQHKWYPLIELNWTRYTFNGSERAINFEGNNLFNFGSMFVAGHSDLTMAAGLRYKFSEAIQAGLVGEFSLVGGSRHMDGFRLTADLIFRY
jgi:hypothetical protein